MHGSLIFEHFNGHLLVAQYAQHDITKLALANALAQLQLRLGYDPTLVHKLFGVDAELLFAQLGQAFDELRAQTIRIGLIVLRRDKEKEIYMYIMRVGSSFDLPPPVVPDSQSIPHRRWSTYSPDT